MFSWYGEESELEKSEVKFATPTIHLDASESDDKLERLARNLDDYLRVAHSLLEGKKGVYDIYIPMNYLTPKSVKFPASSHILSYQRIQSPIEVDCLPSH